MISTAVEFVCHGKPHTAGPSRSDHCCTLGSPPTGGDSVPVRQTAPSILVLIFKLVDWEAPPFHTAASRDSSDKVES